MRILVPAALILLAGCSFYEGDDGPPAWPGEDLPACETTRTSYVIDAITAPVNADLAEAGGRDLDRDGTIDNQLGNVYSAIAQAVHFDIQGRTDEALAADTLLVGLTLEECASPSYTLVELHRGVAIDRSVDPPILTVDLTTELPAVDRVSDGRLLALKGEGRIPPTALFEAEGAEWIEGRELTVELDLFDLEGTLATGVDHLAFEPAAVDVIHRQILRELEGQPGCPLACEDEDLADMVAIFDDDADGEITPEEVEESFLVETLLRPDLDLLLGQGDDATYWPAQDGEPDSLSFGVAFHATPVTLD
jgi:hypothetical protein